MHTGSVVKAAHGSTFVVADVPRSKRFAADVHLIAAAPVLLEAAQAAEQCIVDFLEIYERGGAMLTLDLAAKSLKTDALKRIRSAIAKADHA